MRKKVICLLGPQGAGKTTIGNILAAEFAVPFYQDESIWHSLSILRRTQSKNFPVQGSIAQAEVLLHYLSSNPIVCFETTGLAQDFSEMIEKLQESAEVIVVKIKAPNETCTVRVQTRQSQSRAPLHVSFFNENSGNDLVKFNMEFINDNEADPKNIAQQIFHFIR